MKFKTNHKANHTALLAMRSTRKGFTLIELLVVMAIIATLASVSMGPVLNFLNKGKYTETRQMCNDLKMAIESFESDYSSLPYTGANYPGADGNIVTDATGVGFLDVLLAKEDTINDTGRVYYSPKIAKNNRNGIVYNGADPDTAAVTEVVDHWGNPFTLRLDYDGDGNVDTASISNKFSGIKNQEVIIATPGKDKAWGGDKDLTSWNN